MAIPRALLGVPLLARTGRGRARADAMASRAISPTRQIEIVQTFADQAVIAIENVRLFDEVQARTRELAASLDDLRKAQDRLIQSEKLASLGQLTAGIAHEIKNPLNFVNNFSALSRELLDELRELLAKAKLDEAEREEADELIGMVASNLEKVVQHGKRADSIVKNMLLHSREGSGERASVNVNAMVEEALNLAYHGARAEKPGFNVTIAKSLDPGGGRRRSLPAGDDARAAEPDFQRLLRDAKRKQPRRTGLRADDHRATTRIWATASRSRFATTEPAFPRR
jgi:signal transduction histidine kinase